MTTQASPISVTIMDQSGAGRVAATITLDGIDSRITVRDLIRTRVREEVARYNAAPANTGIFRGLVMPDGAVPAPGGFLMPRPRRVDWERQADRALAPPTHRRGQDPVPLTLQSLPGAREPANRTQAAPAPPAPRPERPEPAITT